MYVKCEDEATGILQVRKKNIGLWAAGREAYTVSVRMEINKGWLITQCFLECKKQGALEKNSTHMFYKKGKAVNFQATHRLGNSLPQDMQIYKCKQVPQRQTHKRKACHSLITIKGSASPESPKSQRHRKAMNLCQGRLVFICPGFTFFSSKQLLLKLTRRNPWPFPDSYGSKTVQLKHTLMKYHAMKWACGL